MGTTRRIMPLIAALIVVAAACGGGSTGDGGGDLDGWLARSGSQAMFLQWTMSDERASGTVTVAVVEGTSVRQDSGSFDGLINDGSVSLTFEKGFGLSSTWNGELDEDRLTLSFNSSEGGLESVTLRPAELRAFRSAVADLERIADAALEEEYLNEAEAFEAQAEADEAAASASAAAEAEQAEADDRKALAAGLRELDYGVDLVTETLRRMEEADLASVRADLETVRREAAVEPMDEYQAEAVAYAAEAVGFSRDAVGYSLDELNEYVSSALAAGSAAETLARRLGDEDALTRVESSRSDLERDRRAAEGVLREAEGLVTEARQIAEAAQQKADSQ